MDTIALPSNYGDVLADDNPAHSIWLIDSNGVVGGHFSSKKIGAAGASSSSRRNKKSSTYVRTPRDFDNNICHRGNESTSNQNSRKFKILGDDVIEVEDSLSSVENHNNNQTQQPHTENIFSFNSISRVPVIPISSGSISDDGSVGSARIENRDVRSVSTENHTSDQTDIAPKNGGNADEVQRCSIDRSYEHHQFREAMFWKSYCDIEAEHRRNFDLHETPSVSEISKKNRSKSWSKIQLLFKRFKRRIDANREYNNIASEDLYSYWEFRISHSYKPVIVILLCHLFCLLVVIPLLYNHYVVQGTIHSDIDRFNPGDLNENSKSIHSIVLSSLPSPTFSPTIVPVAVDFGAHIALLVRCWLWMIPIFLYLIYFMFYLCFSIQTIKRKFNVDMFEIWNKIHRWVLIIRFFHLIENILEMTISSGTCIGGFVKIDFHLVDIMNAYCQMLVLSLLPVSRLFMFYLYFIEVFIVTLRMGTCTEDLFQSESMKHLSFAFVLCNIPLCFTTAGPMAVVVTERTMMSLFRTMKEQLAASAEKMKLVNMLCNDIKIPTQQIARTFGTVDTLLGKACSIDTKYNMDTVKFAAATLNEVVDDLLLVVKVEENRFTFTTTEAVDINLIIYSAMELLCRSLKLSPDLISRIKIEYIESYPNKIHLENVLTSKQFIKAIFYYTLWVIFNYICDDCVTESTVRQRLSSLSIQEHFLTVVVSSSSSICTSKLLNFKLVVSAELWKTSTRPLTTSDSKGTSLFESCCVICSKLTAACFANIDWKITIKSGIIDFSIPFAEDPDFVGTIPNHPAADDSSFDSTPFGEYVPTFAIPTQINKNGEVVRSSEQIPGQVQDPKPPTEETEESKKHDSEDSSAVSDVASSVAYAENKKLLKAFVARNSFAYVTDQGFESIFLDIVRRLPGGRRIAVFRDSIDLNMLKVYRIAIVQSLPACRELRLMKYEGLIILFSERLTYFDEEDKASFGIGLPIPCDDHHLHKLSLLLLQKQREWNKITEIEEIENNMNAVGEEHQKVLNVYSKVRSKESLFTKYWMRSKLRNNKVYLASLDDSMQSYDTDAKYEETKTGTIDLTSNWMWWFSLVEYFDGISQFTFSVIRQVFPLVGKVAHYPHSLNNYCRWKFLNPGKSHLHTSVMTTTSLFTGIFYMIFGYIVSSINWIAFLEMTPFFALILTTRFILKNELDNNGKNDRIGVPFYKLWDILAIIEFALIGIVFMFDFWTPWFGNSPSDHFIHHLHYEPPTTLKQFINQQYGHIYGYEMIVVIITQPFCIRLSAEYLQWPWCFISSILKTIRMAFIASRFFYYILPKPLFIFLFFCYFFALGFLLIDMYWKEKNCRQCFNALYQSIVAKDFRDRLVVLTKHSTSKCVKDICHRQNQLINDLKVNIMRKDVILSNRLFQQIQSLHAHGIACEELLTHLDVSDHIYVSQPRQHLISRMKAAMISNILKSICARFSTFSPTDSAWMTLMTSDNAAVRIYFHVAPALTMVRVDQEIFSAIVVQSLIVAMKHVEQRLRECRKMSHSQGHQWGIDDDHEIVLWLNSFDIRKSNNNGKAVAFTDVRTMTLTVIDTGSLTVSHEISDLPISMKWDSLFSKEDNLPLPKGSAGLHHSRSIASSLGKYFKLPIGYRCGSIVSTQYMPGDALSHQRYRSYQQAAIPYLLCADSFKLGKFVNDQPSSLNCLDQTCIFSSSNPLSSSLLSKRAIKIPFSNVAAVCALQEKFYKQYRNGIGAMLDQLNGCNNMRDFRDTLRLALKEVNTFSNTSFSHAILLTSSSAARKNLEFLKQREKRYYEFFKNHGWQDFSIHTLKNELPTDAMLVTNHIECIIIDTDLKLKIRNAKDSNRGLPGDSSEDSGSEESSRLIKGRDFTTSAILECDALDLLHYLRGKGYQGLVVFAHSRGVAKSTPASEVSNDQKSYSHARFSSSVNPYSHGSHSDYHINLPFHTDDVRFISHLCEERRIQLLLNMNQKIL